MTIASEITRLQTAKAGIKTALEDKGVEVDEAATLDEYPEYIEGLSAGDVVNGVVEQFLSSGEDIKVGAFVEFVQSVGADETIITPASGSTNFTAVALTNTDVFVEYATSGYPTAAIVSFDGESINVGTAVRLSTVATSQQPEVVKMTNTKVFVAVGYSETYGYICTMTGQTISAGAGTLVTSTDGVNSNHRRVIRLDDNNLALIGAGSSNNYYLRGTVIAISGSSSSIGNSRALSSTRYSGCWPALDLVQYSETVSYIVFTNTTQPSAVDAGSLIVSRVNMNYSNGSWTFGQYSLLSKIPSDGSALIQSGYAANLPAASVAAFMANGEVCAIVLYRRSSIAGVYNMRATAFVGFRSSTELVVDATFGAGVRQVIFSKKITLDGKGEVKMLYGISSGGVNNSIYLAKIRVDGTDLSAETFPILDGSYLGDVIAPVETAPLRVFHPGGSAHPINVFELTEKAKTSQFRIDGLAASEVTSTTPGDVWILS